MLHIVTGPLYADLEEVFAQHLHSFRVHTPFTPCTIVVPSKHIRLRLQWAFCAERDLSLFNIHVLTFFQLALRLVEEQGPPVSDTLQSDRFFREWIHHLLQRRKAVSPDLAWLPDMPGGWAALWSTIKDLKDGAVDAVLAREALAQRDEETDPVCQASLTLYDWFRQEQDHRHIFDHDDLTSMACARVASSTFLSQQAHIWYYGFYDLTQVQIDLFHAIAHTYPTSVYFPLVQDHPAYHFAQQFFQRHLLGQRTGMIEHVTGSGRQSPLRMLFAKPVTNTNQHASLPPDHHSQAIVPLQNNHPHDEQNIAPLQEQPVPACQLISVSGVDDEVGIVAKDILRYAEDHHIPWRDIGVVGRTLSGYEHRLPHIFREHGIPFNTTMQRPLAEFPFVQSLLRLLALPVSDFQRDHVMDVLTSPYFQWAGYCPDGEPPQPMLWDRASRRLGITKGFAEWHRFIRVLDKEQRKQTSRNTLSPSLSQITACETVLQAVFKALHDFPASASFSVFVDHTNQLLETFLIPSPLESNTPESPRDAWNRVQARDVDAKQDLAIAQAINDQLTEIRQLTQISDEVSFHEFVKTVDRVMQDTTVPLHPASDIIDGVWVLDAMAARGFSFRVLFLVGVNEQVFPRPIQEDAFLRDPVRRFLDIHAGFKLPEKAAGYDEERLLFYLLINSARETVTLLSHRSNQTSRSPVPSWYITEVQRCVEGLPTTVVPKRDRQKHHVLPQYTDPWLTPQETRVQWMLAHRLPRHPGHAPGWSMIQQGVTMLASQESASPQLNRFDGITGALADWWNEIQAHGISPTALEPYAQCPFKFFAKQILKLEPIEHCEREADIGPREIGILLHDLFKVCVAAFAKQARIRNTKPSSHHDLSEILKPMADSVFQQYEQWHPTGYPLIWEQQQEQLVNVVTHVMLQDLIDATDDWMPIGFEHAVKGELPVGVGNTPLPLIGRIDRMDWSALHHVSRIIDYKYKQSARSIPTAQQLARDVVCGKNLQAPLYLLLAEHGQIALPHQMMDQASPSCSGVWLYYMTLNGQGTNEAFTPVALTAEQWTALKPQFKKTMNGLLTGIQRGAYFIVPDTHCQRCDYRAICHRTHPSSRWRARADHQQTQAHRELRSTKRPLNP